MRLYSSLRDSEASIVLTQSWCSFLMKPSSDTWASLKAPSTSAASLLAGR
eukprot:CAMPEP_0196583926 /NCGR_PEP_ID=MMETSP1081-20130531/45229_1 /TAXON_ID=36882 /ORGANISM="Pyramimonas amylifera, Strain CCMP720" /LENGTH=49 /DNA_ID=CAMNT_0041904965 /DNA_START=8 /DNA_END=157 /DNA_ORIENTATION=+